MNEEKFSGKAEIYAKYRPSYPSEIVDYLYRKTNAETVADIGAGTGIFTKCLLAKSWKVIAVEPNEDMLSQLRSNVSCEIVKSGAENTGIAEHSIDLVTVAQAFHWFNQDLFKAECKRILTRNGIVSLLWNTADESKEIVVKQNEIHKKYCKCYDGRAGANTPQHGSDNIKTSFFKECETRIFDNYLEFTLEEYIGNRLSRSYAPKMDEENYQPFVNALTDFWQKNEKNGKLVIPNIVEVYTGTVI